MQKATKQNYEYDVLIIGAGFAGLAAAIEARLAGSSVIVLEKTKAPGGNSIISDGGIAAPGTLLQKKHGIPDSPEQMYKDMMQAGLGLNHPELVKTLTEKAAATFEWTREFLGLEYLDRVDRFGGHSLARCYTPKERVSGAPLIKALLKKIQELDIPVKKGSSLQKLLISNHRVIAVESSQGTFRARRGVVLASGGFGADVAFRQFQDPRLNASIDSTNKPFATAEVLQAALAAGALPVHLSHIQLGPWASPDEKGFGDGPLFTDYTGFLYGLIVHPRTARRYVNEQTDRKTLADAVLAVGEPSVCFSDEASVRRTGWDLSKALRKGVVKVFNSLEALARHYALPESALKETLHRFNQQLEAKEDTDFQRLFPGDAQALKPPFYGMKIWPKVHYTMGGLGIDPKARVLDLQGQPLEGLYAAGELTGGVHGACRLGSCGITDCLVFGRIAGQQAGIASDE